MRSSLPGLTCALAAIAIGCGTRELDPHGDGGPGAGGSTGVGVDAAMTGSGGMLGIDAAPRPDGLPILIVACGNGLVEIGEECDDGNHVLGDGCSPICQIECHSSCGTCGMPGPCEVSQRCGDGRLGPREACDDGNFRGGDGCASDCASVEAGWICPVAGRRCFPICGDGHAVDPETCDDGNTAAGDGCSAICLVEPSDARCGDGIISGAEPCDDRGLLSPGYGGCTAECRFGGYCGDAVTNGSEQCDLGAGNNTSEYGNMSGCAPGCIFPHFCGDGILDADEGEQCDLGPKNGYHGDGGYSGCTVDCRILID